MILQNFDSIGRANTLTSVHLHRVAAVAVREGQNFGHKARIVLDLKSVRTRGMHRVPFVLCADVDDNRTSAVSCGVDKATGLSRKTRERGLKSERTKFMRLVEFAFFCCC